MRRFGIAAALAVLSVGPMDAQRQESGSSIGAAHVTYDEFLALDVLSRRARFRALDAESQARIKRTHAERWLSANRARLSAAQIAVTEEAIAFLTPELYLRPNDPSVLARDEAIKQKLTCVLGHDNARAAFMFHPSASQDEDARWRQAIDAWLTWFSDCILEQLFAASGEMAARRSVSDDRPSMPDSRRPEAARSYTIVQF